VRHDGQDKLHDLSYVQIIFLGPKGRIVTRPLIILRKFLFVISSTFSMGPDFVCK